MPQSLSALYIHAVFSTKERRRFLQQSSLRKDMHSYLGGISKQLNCAPILIGGVEDHVHLLVRLSRTITMADWIKEIKRSSTVWINQTGRLHNPFSWQAGYGAFSVSVFDLSDLRRYIEDQEGHHHQFTFKDEFRALLKKYGLEYDERYIWD